MNTQAPASPRRRGAVRWGEVRILYGREMRGALREKGVVINSILIPIFLYPFLLWIGFSGIMFVMGQTDRFVSRVAVGSWPREHPQLRRAFQSAGKLQVIRTNLPTGTIEQMIRDGELEAALEFVPAEGDPPGNFEAKLRYNGSNERSESGRRRVAGVIEDYRRQWLEDSALKHGVAPVEWSGFALESRNVASQRQMGAFLLGLLLPVIFVVMVAVGCFYPAVDSIAGERERGTWETLMSTAATRASIVTAKYLCVTTLGGLAGALNVAAVVLTIKPVLAPLLRDHDKIADFTLPLGAIPFLALSAVLLAGFVAAGMMIFASFARTFKEGQAMIMPFYLLVLLPIVFLQVPGLELTLPLALVPVVNITLLVRGAISGTLGWPAAGVAVLASFLVIAVCVRFSAFILKFEDVVSGSYGGSLAKFMRERIFSRGSRPAHPEASS